ncbi:hypothetical protein TVAG_142270 [Trichomonas vaginalis G3]|uniref:Uncharacterized protein n=1 Tax=Trichomonas vaginalis (strain ATCC PRA-98 / G3) TaxID=412133 RepID=A2EHI6_TRIV3|nr:hypothetical protein TVAGG3_0775250 [Trichomonas vaginalis G3]EAY07873.1 hypothetical protein TVAG_142270 [Trichomonas vaginalis G3]KAI5514119.1 hypothetical protein TVAGG3_0775250 [Trichomonas vaginalis G3]|eukprot:XP_001320096.1 hypothetical protein [Trichomonas vaginalis G3]
MNQTVQMYSAEIAKKNQRIHELENQYQSLQQQCSWIYINQNELQQKINECNSLKEQNMRLSDSANYYNFQLNLTKQALEKIRIENENLTNNLNRIQQQLREKTEENQKILSTNETLKVAFKDLIAKINNCKSY